MPRSTSRYSLLTVAQLVISIYGLFASLLALVMLKVLLKMAQASPQYQDLGQQSPTSLYWLLGFISLLAIPSIVLSIRSLQEKPIPAAAPARHGFLRSSLFLVALAPLVYVGMKINRVDGLQPLFPLVCILLTAIPLLWFVEFGRRKLPSGSSQRSWGLLNGNLFFTMPLIFTIEIVFLILAVLWLGAWLIQQPAFAPILLQLQNLSSISPAQIESILSNAQTSFNTPGIMVAVLLGLSVLVPLIEELFKPVLIWLFAKRRLTPAEGFTAGLICGASFALIESTSALSAASGSLFLPTAIGRVGTGLLHTFNTGMMGWALASTWQDGKYHRLGLTYLGVVILHGTWNIFALLFGYGNAGLSIPDQASSLVQAAPYILGLLAVWMLTLMFVMNQRLRQNANPPQIPLQTIPPALPPENITD